MFGLLEMQELEGKGSGHAEPGAHWWQLGRSHMHCWLETLLGTGGPDCRLRSLFL